MKLIIIVVIFLLPAISATATNFHQSMSLNYLPVSEVCPESNFDFKEKIVQPEFENIFQAYHKPGSDSAVDNKIKRKAHWANRLGLSSLRGFFIPFVNFLSLPVAIAAILIGHHTKKLTIDKGIHKEASKGMIAGWITIGLFLIATYFIIRLI